jgi:hypothetical protein
MLATGKASTNNRNISRQDAKIAKVGAPPEKLISGNALGSKSSIIFILQPSRNRVGIGGHNDLSCRH